MYTYLPEEYPRLPLSAFELWSDNYHKGLIDGIQKSIEEFGFNGALRVRFDGQSCTIYAGNSSCIALRRIKESGGRIPHNIVAEPSGDWLIPYINISHLSLARCEAFAFADNNLTRLGTDDEAAVAALLSRIAVTDPSLLSAASVNQSVIDDILSEIESPSLPPSVPDFAPDPDAFQGSFGEEKKIQCPCCGERFVAPK